eukprot:6425237-Pyramimonas_sp.AAC.1
MRASSASSALACSTCSGLDGGRAAMRSARHLDEPCRTCLNNLRCVWKLSPHAVHTVPDT